MKKGKQIAALLLALTMLLSLCACGQGAEAQPEEAAEPTAEPAPTPEPTPEPTPAPLGVESLEIRYTYDDLIREDVTMRVGEKLPLYAAIMPAEIQGFVEWSIDEEGQDAFILTEDKTDPNHVIVECVDGLGAGIGGVSLHASIDGKEAHCVLHAVGAAPKDENGERLAQPIEIRYFYDDQVRVDVTIRVGETLPLYAAILSEELEGPVEWTVDEEGQQALKLTVDEQDPNKVTVESVGNLPADSGGVYVHAKIGEQEARCKIHVVGGTTVSEEARNSGLEGIEIRFALNNSVLHDVTLRSGEKISVYAALLPEGSTGQVEWRVEGDCKDYFILSPDDSAPGRITVECTDTPPEGRRSAMLYASFGGLETGCVLRING